jgi:hypothetical protein
MIETLHRYYDIQIRRILFIDNGKLEREPHRFLMACGLVDVMRCFAENALIVVRQEEGPAFSSRSSSSSRQATGGHSRPQAIWENLQYSVLSMWQDCELCELYISIISCTN